MQMLEIKVFVGFKVQKIVSACDSGDPVYTGKMFVSDCSMWASGLQLGGVYQAMALLGIFIVPILSSPCAGSTRADER